MHYFALTKEIERVKNALVIGKGHKVLVSGTGFLLRSQVLMKICYRVTGAGDVCRCERHAVGVGGENAAAVHGVITGHAGFVYLGIACAAHALINHGAEHFPMGQFLCAYVVKRGTAAVVRIVHD